MKMTFGATASALLVAGLMGLASISPASALTNKECNAQWKSDPQGQAAGMKFKDYKAANCGAEAPAAAPAAAAPAAAPAPAAAAPAPAAAPKAAAAPAAAPAAAAPAAAPAPAAAAKPMPKPAAAPAAAMNANEFTTEADAKGHCPSDTVVWVNTNSHKWHYAGSKAYGKTKKGAYMCEKDASAAGNVASKNEKAPAPAQ